MNRIYLIAALSLALCISLGINIHQYLDSFEREIAAPLQAKIQSYAATEQINVAVSKARAKDSAEIERLRKAQRSAQARVEVRWRERIKQLPAPACSPGHDRVAAWNSLATGEQP